LETKKYLSRVEPIMSSILDNLPAVIKNEIQLDDVKSVIDDGEMKPIILVHSRALEVQEKDLLKSYGTVMEWTDSFVNIPIAKLKFDYLLVDVNSKNARLLLMKNVLDPYDVVILCKKYEMEDDYIDDIKHCNVIRHLPDRSPFKVEFNRLMLNPKIRQPSCAKAVLRLFLSLFGGYGKR
jgi:hypothetical protein